MGNTAQQKKQYQVVNGTSYDHRTDPVVISYLEYARTNRLRIELDYGDVETGKSWGDIHDITGYVGRSTGRIKIPILLHNSRSMGGGAILDHCIIRIRTSKGKDILYKHQNHTS